MDNRAQEVAGSLVEMFWVQFAPDIKKAFENKVIQLASERWRYAWSTDAVITDLVDKAIKEHLETTFKPALDEIARLKAKEKVLKRAKQNGIPAETLPLLEGIT